METIKVDAIFVIESLNSDDIKSGKSLYNDIITYYSDKYNGFDTDFYQAKNKDQFISYMRRIVSRVKNDNIHPIIHIECHGDENRKGLIINPSKELITWTELEEYFRPINIAMRNNLLITLGVCHGAQLQTIIDPYKPAPFFAMIAPKKLISADVTIKGYNNFYKSILLDPDIINAIREIKIFSEFGLYASEPIYLDFFEKNLLKGLEENQLVATCRENVLLIFSCNGSNSFSEEKYNELFNHQYRFIKSELIEYIQKCRRVFFMLDKYPENNERFEKLQLIRARL